MKQVTINFDDDSNYNMVEAALMDIYGGEDMAEAVLNSARAAVKKYLFRLKQVEAEAAVETFRKNYDDSTIFVKENVTVTESK